MPLLPLFNAGSWERHQVPIIPHFDIVGPFWGLTRNLGAHHLVIVMQLWTPSTFYCNIFDLCKSSITQNVLSITIITTH